MKQILAVAALVMMTALTYAQENVVKAEVQPDKQEVVDGPIMTLEAMEVSYGTIEQGSDPLRKVAFTNTGTQPLVISNARGSCGCTVPTWPKEPIAPGETGEIEIRYDTKRLGNINKTVKLTTNDPTGTYVIRVTGKINPKEQEEGLPKKDGIFGEPDKN